MECLIKSSNLTAVIMSVLNSTDSFSRNLVFPRVFRYAGYRNEWQVEVVLLFCRTDVRDGLL